MNAPLPNIQTNHAPNPQDPTCEPHLPSSKFETQNSQPEDAHILANSQTGSPPSPKANLTSQTHKLTNSQTGPRPGRPTKSTPQVRAAILHCIAMGLSYERACRAAGITSETLRVWRKNDPGLADDIAQAEGQAILTHLDILDAACQKSWRAAAWWLERKCPESFGKTQPLTVSEKLRLADLNRALVFDDQLAPTEPEPQPAPNLPSETAAANIQAPDQNRLQPATAPASEAEISELANSTLLAPLTPIRKNHEKTPRKPRKSLPASRGESQSRPSIVSASQDTGSLAIPVPSAAPEPPHTVSAPTEQNHAQTPRNPRKLPPSRVLTPVSPDTNSRSARKARPDRRQYQRSAFMAEPTRSTCAGAQSMRNLNAFAVPNPLRLVFDTAALRKIRNIETSPKTVYAHPRTRS